MKKFVSTFLAVIMILSSVTAFAFAADNNRDIPIIRVTGYGPDILAADGSVIYPPESNYDIGEYVKQVTPGILKELGISLLTDKWDNYCDSLYEAIAKLYEDFPVDKNGEVTDGSYACDVYRNEETLKNIRTSNYNTYELDFRYDWRKSPLDVADELNDYINTVIEKTGHKKVALFGRCLGGAIISAYIAEYGTQKVDSLVYYATTVNGGVGTVDALFTGDASFDPEAVDRFVNYYVNRKGLSGDEVMDDFIIALCSILTYCKVLPAAEDAIEVIYAKVKENVVPRLLLACYGGLPSFWSMVSPEYYNKAKAFVFNGREDEYAGFIKKIDDYKNNVQDKISGILKNFENEGGRVAILAKYGLNAPPICQNPNAQSDAMVLTSNHSFGATCSDINKKFSQSYIDQATQAGTEKYISPDKKIDASTCLFPDTTWFIKNCPHSGEWPEYIDEHLILTFIEGQERLTVWDNADWPQYMNYNMKTGDFSDVTADENEDSRWTNNIMQALIRFLATLIKVFAQLISKSA
ncbi:MAG: esterase/lipase family protein [Acutalibacteraceae bacterium]